MNTSNTSTPSASRDLGWRLVYIYSAARLRPLLKARQPFRMNGGGVYALADSGAFLRLDKDRRSRKERKRERRLAREHKAAA